MAGLIMMPLGTEVGIGPGHIVLDGDSAAPKKGAQPQFSAHVCRGQMVTHLSYCWALVILNVTSCAASYFYCYVQVSLVWW